VEWELIFENFIFYPEFQAEGISFSCCLLGKKSRSMLLLALYHPIPIFHAEWIRGDNVEKNEDNEDSSGQEKCF
jgi:hypothetical protein